MITLIVQLDGKSQERRFDQNACRLGPPNLDGIDLQVPSELSELWAISVTVSEGKCRVVSSVESVAITMDGTPFEEMELTNPKATLVIGGTTVQLVWDAAVAQSFKDAVGQEIPTGELDIDAELAKINEIFQLDAEDDVTADIDPALLSEEQLERLIKEATEYQAPTAGTAAMAEAVAPVVTKPTKAEFSDDIIDPELDELIDDMRSGTKMVAGDRGSVKRHFDSTVKEETSFERARVLEEADWRDLEIADEKSGDGDRASRKKGAHKGDAQEGTSGYKRPKSRLRALLMALAAVFVICAGVAVITVNRATVANAGFERAAAIGIADLGMALLETGDLNSQTGIDPLSQDFLRERLTNIIAEPYFASSPFLTGRDNLLSAYDYRVVRSRDFKRFVVIASPTPRFFTSLMPKAKFLVTSTSMEVRQVMDLQAWTDLFQGKTYLDEVDPVRVASLEAAARPVRLASLDDRYLSNGFSPPKALVNRTSQAAAKIYNVPRYYPFAHRLVAALQEAQGAANNAQARADLDQLMAAHSPLSNLVVYTAQGPEEADLLQDMLTREWKDSSVQVGYVVLEGKTARVIECDLAPSLSASLEQEDESEVADKPGDGEAAKKNADSVKVDPQHPLYINLMELANERRVDLEHYSKRLAELMSDHNAHESEDFFAQQKELSTAYQEASDEHKRKISLVLASLAKAARTNDPQNGIATLIAYARAAELTDFLPDDLRPKDQPDAADGTVGKKASIPVLLTALSRAETLTDLSAIVARVATALAQDETPITDVERTNFYGELRARTVQKINQLVLSPTGQNPADIFTTENRLLLTRTLDNARVTEQEERTYYVDEFDRLIAKYQGADRSYSAGEANADPAQAKAEEQARKSVEKQLTAVPMDLATTSPALQQKNSARLGQQILVQASQMAPGTDRDHRLVEAISLIAVGTEENRALWQDILEARRLLSEAPESILSHAMGSDLGITPAPNSRVKQLRVLMQNYITQLADLVAVQNAQQYDAQLPNFREQQGAKLQEIVQQATQVTKDTQGSLASLEQYLDRLEAFATDYETAKKEGFFVNNRGYHQGNLTQLRRKISRLHTLTKEFQQRCEQVQQLSEVIVRIASAEKGLLDAGQMVDADHLSDLRKQLAVTTEMDAAPAAPVVDKMRKAIAMEVRPVPAP